MAQETIWFPHGTRLEAPFAIADLKIRALAGFVRDVAADLDRGNSLASAVRRAAQQHPAAADAFEFDHDDSLIEARFALRDGLTFPDEPLPAAINFERDQSRVSLRLDSFLAHDVRALISMCGTGRWTAKQIRDAIDEPISSLFESLLEKDIVVAGEQPPALPLASSPGVTRLQHAGLLYRGDRTRILVDPHFHSSYEPDDLADNFLRAQFEGLVEAILISHGHRDHWHLPTLLSFPPDTTIVVPKVSRATMLCPDFATTLRAFGFTRVIPLGWFDPPLVVGDLEIHALPFYGEQPLLNDLPRHPDLRNNGNTYVVRHNSYTSWFLIDSGNDWLGSMAQVAREVKARFGRIDMLMSNLLKFAIYTPMYITGAGHYWLSLKPDQLRRFSSMANDVITLGPGGVAEICQIVDARRFLPYAHGWEGIGARPEPHERVLLEQLGSSLAQLGVKTRIVQWRIGDSCLAENVDDATEPVAY